MRCFFFFLFKLKKIVTLPKKNKKKKPERIYMFIILSVCGATVKTMASLTSKQNLNDAWNCNMDQKIWAQNNLFVLSVVVLFLIEIKFIHWSHFVSAPNRIKYRGKESSIVITLKKFLLSVVTWLDFVYEFRKTNSNRNFFFVPFFKSFKSYKSSVP